MGDTNIEWADRVWNVVRGCSRVSAGCVNCYAERQAIRQSGPGGNYAGLVRAHPKPDGRREPRWTGEVRFVPEKLHEPLSWKSGRVFVNSMSDLFHESLPDEAIDRVFAVMLLAPQHTFQILTKRPERMRAYLTAPGLYDRVLRAAEGLRGTSPPARRLDLTRIGISDPARFPAPWIWLGVSVEDHATADERIPVLLQTPAALRWVSYEPALGAVDFAEWIGPHTCCNGCGDVTPGDHHLCPSCGQDNAITTWGDAQLGRWESGERYTANGGAGHEDLCRGPGLDWIVVGGESGPGARPFDLAWARSTIAQCREAGVRTFFKQAGAHPILDGERLRLRDRKGGDLAELQADLNVREFPDAA